MVRLVMDEIAPDIAGGTINKNGIRHEDLVKLSFGDEELDCIVSNDILEHVASIEKAFYSVSYGNFGINSLFIFIDRK